MIKISKAKPKESQSIRQFEQLVWNETDITSPYDIVSFVTYGYVFLAEDTEKDKDKIVGTIVAIKTKDNEIRIVDWIVHEQYRHTGIGTRLYKRLRKEIGNLTMIAYVESDNTASIEGHKKLGFKPTKKVKDPFFIGEKKNWLVMKSK